jgi:hypothetical protein
LSALEILDEIEQRGRLDPESIEQSLNVDDVRRAVPTEPHQIGCNIVRESIIQQPWRQRFLLASVGSTRVPEGLYAHDWYGFLVEWQNEMRLWEKHRAARGEH